jgi:hypothetical protein
LLIRFSTIPHIHPCYNSVFVILWAITACPTCLALRRIGSYFVESLFGTTRSILRNETRWERFLRRTWMLC